MLGILRRDADRAIINVGMAAFVARDIDAKCIALKLLGEIDDAARQCRREQQRAAGIRRGLEDDLHVLAKAEIEHLVGFVEHYGLKTRHVETSTAKMVAQASGRTDDDMRTICEFAHFLARVHAADAGDDARASLPIEPAQFAMHLQGQFAGRCHDQRQRRAAAWQSFRIAEQFAGNRKAIGDGLAGTGLGGHQEIAPGGLICQNGGLNGGRIGVILFRKGAGKRRGSAEKCHGQLDSGRFWPAAADAARQKGNACGSCARYGRGHFRSADTMI